jgi:hypothetical protein
VTKWILMLVVALFPVDEEHPTLGELRCWGRWLEPPNGVCGDMYGTPTPSLRSACMQIVARGCQLRYGD